MFGEVPETAMGSVRIYLCRKSFKLRLNNRDRLYLDDLIDTLSDTLPVRIGSLIRYFQDYNSNTDYLPYKYSSTHRGAAVRRMRDIIENGILFSKNSILKFYLIGKDTVLTIILCLMH